MSNDILEINSPVIIYNTREYGAKLLFVNNQLNPRDVLGKMGITFHKPYTALGIWSFKVQVKLLDEEGKITPKSMYINRKSLRKYLGALSEEGTDLSKKTDAQLVEMLNEHSWNDHSKNATKSSFKGEQGLRHAGRYNRQKLSSFISALWVNTLGRFFSWLYRATISGLNRFKIRFLFINKEKEYFEVGEKLAGMRYKEAKKDVPAYKEHVKGTDAKTLSEVPPTTKDSYIQPYSKHHWKTHKKGKLPKQYKIDTSTGTTEAPTVWVRSDEEIATVQRSLHTAWKIIMGNRKPMIINAFALGPWATGLSIHEIARQIGAVASIGADADKIFQTIDDRYRYEQELQDQALRYFLKEKSLDPSLKDTINHRINALFKELLVNPTYTLKDVAKKHIDIPELKKHQSSLLKVLKKINSEKMQIAITGYPPFLLAFADYVKAKNIDFSQYNVVCGAGGQAVGEPMRRAMIEKGYMKVTSSYGASDLDINVGLETDSEVQIRQALEKNPAMARELYGSNVGVPMVFRYDPLNYHIECSDKDNHLIMTCTRDNRSSPRVRYDIKDTGRIYASSDVFGMLKKYGVFSKTMNENANLPFLFIWGRDSTVGYGTCNVPFDELESALHTIGNPNILKQAFYQFETNHISRFDVYLELNDGVDFLCAEEGKAFQVQVIAAMEQKNEYFAEEINRLGDDDHIPAIHFFKRNKSPIAEPGGQRKQVLIFRQEYKGADEDKRTATMTKKEYMVMRKEFYQQPTSKA